MPRARDVFHGARLEAVGPLAQLGLRTVDPLCGVWKLWPWLQDVGTCCEGPEPRPPGCQVFGCQAPRPRPLLALRSQAFPGPAPGPGLQLPLHSGGVGSPQRAGGPGRESPASLGAWPRSRLDLFCLWFPLLPWGWFDSLPLTFPLGSSRGVPCKRATWAAGCCPGEGRCPSVGSLGTWISAALHARKPGPDTHPASLPGPTGVPAGSGWWEGTLPTVRRTPRLGRRHLGPEGLAPGGAGGLSVEAGGAMALE